MNGLTPQGLLFVGILSLSLIGSGYLLFEEIFTPEKESTLETVQRSPSGLVERQFPALEAEPPPPEEVHWTDRFVNVLKAVEGFLIALTPLLSPVIVYGIQRKTGKYLIRRVPEEPIK